MSEAPEGIAVSALACRTGERVETLVRASPSTIHRFGEWWMHDEVVRSKLATWKNQMDAFHRAILCYQGRARKNCAAGAYGVRRPSVFEAMLALDKQIAGRWRVRSPREPPHLPCKTDEREASARIEAPFDTPGSRFRSVAEVFKSSGVDPVRARTLLQILLRDRKLVRVSEDLVFHAIAIESLKQALAGRKGQHSRWLISKSGLAFPANMRSRLLEWLDRERSHDAKATHESSYRSAFSVPRYNLFVPYSVTLIPGDGIGPEVADAAVRAVDATGVQINWHRVELTSAHHSELRPGASELHSGLAEPDDGRFKGPVTTPVAGGFQSVNVALRKKMDLYANVRRCERCRA